MIIYKVTNKISGRVYIGQTTMTLKKRRLSHIYESKNSSKNHYFSNALNKYVADSFKWQVICICPNIDILNEQEKYYIAFYDCMNLGYNRTTGGLNYIVSDETKSKMSIANTGRLVSQKTRDKIGNANKGRNPSAKTRDSMRLAQTGRIQSDKTKEKIRQSHLGMKHTEETKQKISITKLKNKFRHSDETKKKMSQTRKGRPSTMLGKHHSEESKKKISDAIKGKKNPMYGMKGELSPCFGKKHSKETRKKMSESNKKRWIKRKELINVKN